MLAILESKLDKSLSFPEGDNVGQKVNVKEMNEHKRDNT